MNNLYKLHWNIKVKQQIQNTNLAFREYSAKIDINIRCNKDIFLYACIFTVEPIDLTSL